MPYSSRFESALVYAARVHADQVRKTSGVPYIAHLLSVAALVAEYGGDEDQVIAALLHDAPEDQGGRPRLDEIGVRFGPRVADLVAACTDTLEDPKPPWRARKEAYLAALDSVPRDALLVSMADKLHNSRSLVADLRSVGEQAFERFNGKKDGTLWYYRSLVAVYDRLCPGPLLDELRRVVDEMHGLAGAGPK